MPLTPEQIADGWIEVNDTPSARITGDKDRENPVEGAPYGEGLIGRIDDLEAKLRATAIEAHRMRSCLQYIEGVGYVDHQSGNANFEYLQGLARSALGTPTAPSGDEVERAAQVADEHACQHCAHISAAIRAITTEGADK